MTQPACAGRAPAAARAVNTTSVYLSRPSLERFDSVTIALRCTLSDTSRVGSGGVESTICATWWLGGLRDGRLPRLHPAAQGLTERRTTSPGAAAARCPSSSDSRPAPPP